MAPCSHEQTRWGGPIPDVPLTLVGVGDPPSVTAMPGDTREVCGDRGGGTGLCLPVYGDPEAQLRVLGAPPGQGGLDPALSIHCRGGKGMWTSSRGRSWEDNKEPRVTQRDPGHPKNPQAQLGQGPQGGRDPIQGRL